MPNFSIIQNGNVKLKTRGMFLTSLMRSILSYGCHALSQTRSEIYKLSAVSVVTVVCNQLLKSMAKGCLVRNL